MLRLVTSDHTPGLPRVTPKSWAACQCGYARCPECASPWPLIGAGRTLETDAGLRIHRFRDALRVLDLTHAGKRGKVCGEWSLSHWNLDIDGETPEAEQLRDLVRSLPLQPSYAAALAAVRLLKASLGWAVDLSEHEHKAVSIAPVGCVAVVLAGDGCTIRAEWDSFSVRDDSDPNNLPTVIQGRNDTRGVRRFYGWARDNVAVLEAMTFREVCGALDRLNVRMHYFCAMD